MFGPRFSERAWLALACFATSTLARGQEPAAPSHLRPLATGLSVPKELAWDPAYTSGINLWWSNDDREFVRLGHDAGTRTVELLAGFVPDPTDDSRFVDRSVEYDVDFWPTCVDTVGANTIAVAGSRGGGNLVIEVWTFDPPVLTAGPSPVLEPGPRISVESVFDGPCGAEVFVERVRADLDASASLFLCYWRTHEIDVLDTHARTLTRVASPERGRAGLIVLPELAGAFEFWNTVEHPTDGTIYVMGGRRGDCFVPDEDEVGWLAFYDCDRDGRLDFARALAGKGLDRLLIRGADAWSRPWPP